MKKILLVFFAFAFVLTARAQERIVSGKVTAEDGSTLPGVNVVLKGTTSGTVTDAGGKYSLTIPAGGGSLIFSFIGYKTQEVPIGERNIVDIQMGSDVTQLSEIVVTGSGVATDRKKLGIAVESVTAAQLPATPTASIDQALIGKIPGAQISSISGNPGDPVNIVLRGINTVQNGTRPLIMVDGVQVAATDINSLDLNNVERVEVVQGAASAALYGAQGANGVIQIFTKRGKQGKISVNYSTSYASNEFINSGNVHKARTHPYLTDSNNNIIDATTLQPLQYDQYGSISGISYANGGPTRYALVENTENVFSKPYNANLKYYDHFKEMFQKGNTVNNNISLSGASEKSDFALSVSNNHTLSPVMQNGSVDRTNVTLNLGTELFKGFKLRSTTQLVYTRNNLHPGLGAAGGILYGQGNSLGNVANIYSFLNTSPFFDLKYKLADGTSPAYQVADFVSVNAFNPFYVQEYTQGLDNKIDVIQSFNANYVVNKFIELDAKYGLNYRNENARWTYFNQSQNINSNYYGSWASNYNPANDGEIDNFQYTTTFQNFLASMYIRTDFEDDFHLKLPIQTSTQVSFDYRKKYYKEYDSYGLTLPLQPPINLQSTSSQYTAFDYVEPFITYGYLVNQKIDFGDIGGVTGGVRSDYSSAFGGGSKPFTFPHADAHILPSSLWKNSSLANTFPYLKFRAAYGQAGIQPGPFDRFPVLNQQSLGSGSGAQLEYSVPITSNNPNLHVEVSTEKEIGTDFTFNLLKSGSWLNSVTGSFTYWARTSANVIFAVPVPPSSGSTGILTNSIGMSSNGVQFQLNLPAYKSNSLEWDVTTNFGHQISRIDAIQGNTDIILTSIGGAQSGAQSTGIVLRAGQQIGQIYGYKALTNTNYVNQEGVPYISAANAGNYSVVDGRLVDNNTKQIQFTNEKYPLGNPNPKFNASLINNIRYKDFLTFSFQFDWIHGSHLYNQTKEWMYRDGISGDFDRKVTINGETGAFTAYNSSPYYNLWGSLHGAGNDATKDYFWENASFIRLRNISVAFDFAKVMKVSTFRKFQLVLTGRNLLTFTKYTGYDPEISAGQPNSSFDRGVDNSTLPNIKSYQVGLNVGF
jgi:TonB-linked SusC/RagA family outer membrane protein